MPERVLAAVHELTDEVKKLQTQLKQYPKREEVKHESRKRAFRFFGTAMVVILISQLLTMTTISYCFLSPMQNSGRTACSIMPGYDNAIQVGRERQARFELVMSEIELNEARISEIHARLDELEGK